MRWRIRGQKEKTTFDYCLRCRRTHAVDSQVALVSPFPVSADSRLKSGWNDREKVSEAAIYWQLTAFITFQVADASLFLKKEGQQTHHSNKQADASHKMRFLQPAKDTSHSQTSALPNCRQNRSRRNADNWSDLLHNEKKRKTLYKISNSIHYKGIKKGSVITEQFPKRKLAKWACVWGCICTTSTTTTATDCSRRLQHRHTLPNWPLANATRLANKSMLNEECSNSSSSKWIEWQSLVAVTVRYEFELLLALVHALQNGAVTDWFSINFRSGAWLQCLTMVRLGNFLYVYGFFFSNNYPTDQRVCNSLNNKK